MGRPQVQVRQVPVRLDLDLYAWVRADAEAHGRTVAQSIRFHLHAARYMAATPEERMTMDEETV